MKEQLRTGGYNLRRRKKNPAKKKNHFSAVQLDDTSVFPVNNQEEVKCYLRFRVVIVQVVECAVVRVVGFVQQLDGKCPAERLRHKRMLEDKQERDSI